MNSEILNRKGARKVEDVPKAVLTLLNKGEIESVNLIEWLAIDHLKLMQVVFPQMGISKTIINKISEAVEQQKKPSTVSSVKLISSLLYEHIADHKKRALILTKLSTHISDSIRCYATFLISLNSDLVIDEKFEQIKSLAADTHFGVREIAWMALRPEIDKNLERSIDILTEWTGDEDENIRRFATESTRPRGVWCKHIDALKEQPELALKLLNKLSSDESKYVQDSVGNWLNDASKTKPDFVIALCDKWAAGSPSKATEKIIKRAKRSINKK